MLVRNAFYEQFHSEWCLVLENCLCAQKKFQRNKFLEGITIQGLPTFPLSGVLEKILLSHVIPDDWTFLGKFLEGKPFMCVLSWLPL